MLSYIRSKAISFAPEFDRETARPSLVMLIVIFLTLQPAMAQSASATIYITTDSDWTTLTLDSREYFSRVSYQILEGAGAPDLRISFDSKNLRIWKKSFDTTLVKVKFDVTLDNLGGEDVYVNYRITKGDINGSLIEIEASGYLIASRYNDWDIPDNSYNDLKFNVPTTAHQTGNIQRMMVYDVTTRSDWTCLLVPGDEYFSNVSYIIKEGFKARGLTIRWNSESLCIEKMVFDKTLVDVEFQATLNKLRVGDMNTSDIHSVKYDIQKGDIKFTNVKIYAPGEGSFRTLISDVTNSQDIPGGTNDLYYSVLDNRHIYWDNIVTTFYYPWFGRPEFGHGWKSWNGAGHSPTCSWASNYQPNIVDAFNPKDNLYDSFDLNTTLWQLSKMKQAGIELAVSSWWGQGSYEDKALKNILQNVMSRIDNPYPQLKWAVYYENEGYSDPSADQIYSDLKYILTNLTTSPYYARIDGMPVIFVFRAPCDAARWYQAKQRLASEGLWIYLSADCSSAINPSLLGQQPNSHESLYTYDAYHVYEPTQRGLCTDTYTSDSPQGDSCFVSPGFWKYHEPAALERDEVAYELNLGNYVNDILGSPSSMRFVAIETWNEYMEGTMIEPGRLINHSDDACFNDGSYNFNNDFVSRTWKLVGQFKY